MRSQAPRWARVIWRTTCLLICKLAWARRLRVALIIQTVLLEATPPPSLFDRSSIFSWRTHAPSLNFRRKSMPRIEMGCSRRSSHMPKPKSTFRICKCCFRHCQLISLAEDTQRPCYQGSTSPASCRGPYARANRPSGWFKSSWILPSGWDNRWYKCLGFALRRKCFRPRCPWIPAGTVGREQWPDEDRTAEKNGEELFRSTLNPPHL